MYRFLALVYSLFFIDCAVLTAQSNFLQTSPLQNAAETQHSAKVFQQDSSFYVLRLDQRNTFATIEQLDTQLQTVQTHPLGALNKEFSRILQYNQNPYLLFLKQRFEGTNNSRQVLSLYLRQVHLDSVHLDPNYIPLVEPITLQEEYFRVNVVPSPQHRYLLVYYYQEKGDLVPGLTNIIHLRVFDRALNLSWSREVNLALPSRKVRSVAIKHLAIDDQGRVSILTDIFNENREYFARKGKPSAQPAIYFVDAERFQRFRPTLPAYCYHNMRLAYDRKSRLHFFGTFSEKNYDRQLGTFNLMIDSAQRVVLHQHIQDFERDFQRGQLSEKQIERRVGFRHFTLKHWFLSDTGALYFSLEQEIDKATILKSHHIGLFAFMPDGRPRWSHFIPKHSSQPLRERKFLSHYFYVHHDEVYLFFNRGIYADNHFTVGIHVDTSGQLRNQDLWMHRNIDAVYLPQKTKIAPPHHFFFAFDSRFGKYHRYGLFDWAAWRNELIHTETP